MESGAAVCMGAKKGVPTQKWTLTAQGCIQSQATAGESHIPWSGVYVCGLRDAQMANR